MIEMTLAEVGALTGGAVRGEGDRVIRGVAPLERAGPHDLSFVANPRYLPYLQDTRAGALLVSATLQAEARPDLPRVVVDDPHLALYRVLSRLHPTRAPRAGIHPSAVVDPAAEVAPDASIGPYAVLEAGACIGARAVVGAHTVVGEDVRVGADCVLHPHVTLYPGVVLGERCVVHSGARVGNDGFGFVWAEGGHRKVPQVGGCVVEDDVEIGANCTIDRGSIGDTVLGAGSKLDSLVHLGHNVKLGRHVLLVAQVGIAGSSSVGDGAVLAGQVGVAGHLSIGAGAKLAAQAGVIGDVPPGETYSGYPARPHREALRAAGMLFRLPELLRRVRALESARSGSKND